MITKLGDLLNALDTWVSAFPCTGASLEVRNGLAMMIDAGYSVTVRVEYAVSDEVRKSVGEGKDKSIWCI